MTRVMDWLLTRDRRPIRPPKNPFIVMDGHKPRSGPYTRAEFTRYVNRKQPVGDAGPKPRPNTSPLRPEDV